jgi:transcriptional regulator with XRE-family HTH domain
VALKLDATLVKRLLGQAIAAERLSSQNDLAREVGVAPSRVSAWLTKGEFPEGDRLYLLAAVLDVPPERLIVGHEDQLRATALRYARWAFGEGADDVLAALPQLKPYTPIRGAQTRGAVRREAAGEVSEEIRRARESEPDATRPEEPPAKPPSHPSRGS